MRLVTTCIGVCVIGVALSAQLAEPAFEVASVKPSPASRPSRFTIQPGGRLVGGNLTAGLLIQRGYGLQPYALDGLPPWANRDPFDIQAKAPEREAPYLSSEVLAMVRQLLADRFGLTAHRGIRVRPVFLLVRDRPDRPPSANMRPSSIDCTGRRPADTGLPAAECGTFAAIRQAENSITVTYRGRNMDEFSHDLTVRAGRPVLDRSGIEGQYDVELTFERGQDVFTPLREQLGLRLASEEAPIEMLIVDAIHPPTPD